MSTEPKLTHDKLAQAPPGVQNIVICWSGQDIIAIGYAQPFKLFFVYEGGGGNTTVNVSIDNAPFAPLTQGQYNWSVNSVVGLQINVDPNAPVKFVWVFQ
jgi:hypothetical protein